MWPWLILAAVPAALTYLARREQKREQEVYDIQWAEERAKEARAVAEEARKAAKEQRELMKERREEEERVVKRAGRQVALRVLECANAALTVDGIVVAGTVADVSSTHVVLDYEDGEEYAIPIDAIDAASVVVVKGGEPLEEEAEEEAAEEEEEAYS